MKGNIKKVGTSNRNQSLYQDQEAIHFKINLLAKSSK